MRPEKASIVSDLSEKLNRSPFILVTDYQRMNVNHFADLRNRLAANGAEVHVVKNSFLRRAIADSGLPDVTDQLTGQTAVVTGENDAAPVAKILKRFAAEFKIAALKIGIVDKSILSTKEIEALAELPSLPAGWRWIAPPETCGWARSPFPLPASRAKHCVAGRACQRPTPLRRGLVAT